jgi:predicted Zn-dependent protease
LEAETPNAYISGYNIIFYDVILDDFPEDEVCGIFAHEVCHKALGHYSTKLVASQTTTQAMILLDRVVPGLGYLNYIINPLVTSFFSRELEVQADKTAVDTLIKAQRDPTAYLRALEHLDEWCVENGIKRDKRRPLRRPSGHAGKDRDDQRIHRVKIMAIVHKKKDGRVFCDYLEHGRVSGRPSGEDPRRQSRRDPAS